MGTLSQFDNKKPEELESEFDYFDLDNSSPSSPLKGLNIVDLDFVYNQLLDGYKASTLIRPQLAKWFDHQKFGNRYFSKILRKIYHRRNSFENFMILAFFWISIQFRFRVGFLVSNFADLFLRELQTKHQADQREVHSACRFSCLTGKCRHGSSLEKVIWKACKIWNIFI